MLGDLLSNRLVAAIVFAIAVPLVLIGYILLVEAILRVVPRRWAAGLCTGATPTAITRSSTASPSIRSTTS